MLKVKFKKMQEIVLELGKPYAALSLVNKVVPAFIVLSIMKKLFII